MTGKPQFQFDFEPGLLERFPTFLECLQASTHGCERALKIIAADLEMTSQELGRKLANNPNDPVNFPAKLLPDLVEATGSLLPVYWLIEKFCETPEAKKQRVLQRLDEFLTEFPQLIKAAREGEK